MTELRCGSCGATPEGLAPWRCASCGSPLDLVLPPADRTTFAEGAESAAGTEGASSAPGAAGAEGVWRYRGWLPSVDPVVLGEPRTAMVELTDHGRTVLAKLEGGLPTGSFKDRGTAVTVSWLRARGVREIVVDSSGNAGASFAAYGARAGIRVRVFVPADASPAKLLQIRAHGAIVVTVPGPRAAAGDAARDTLETAGPDVAYASHLWQGAFLAGTATFAYEVFEQLGRRAPAAIVAPLGGGTLLLGAHIGFGRLRDAGLIDAVPRFIGVQSSACAPLARAFRTGEADAVEVAPAATIAEGIRIGRPPRSRQILAAIRETSGDIIEVTDNEIRDALRSLLAHGLFVEPTSAAAYAGLARLGDGNNAVVVAMTGHGLKAAGPVGDLLAAEVASR